VGDAGGCTTIRAMRLCADCLTTLAAIHIEPPWFLLSSRFSLEDTPVEAISFHFRKEFDDGRSRDSYHCDPQDPGGQSMVVLAALVPGTGIPESYPAKTANQPPDAT
jgi:hypothetical protein